MKKRQQIEKIGKQGTQGLTDAQIGFLLELLDVVNIKGFEQKLVVVQIMARLRSMSGQPILSAPPAPPVEAPVTGPSRENDNG